MYDLTRTWLVARTRTQLVSACVMMTLEFRPVSIIMSSLSNDERWAMVQFLDEIKASIHRIEREAAYAEVDDLLLDAERLLQDVTFLSDQFPAENGDSFLQAIADVYLWLENRRIASMSMRGRLRIEIPQEQLALFCPSSSHQVVLLHAPSFCKKRFEGQLWSMGWRKNTSTPQFLMSSLMLLPWSLSTIAHWWPD